MIRSINYLHSYLPMTWLWDRSPDCAAAAADHAFATTWDARKLLLFISVEDMLKGKTEEIKGSGH
jgi:hypothetical protein